MLLADNYYHHSWWVCTWSKEYLFLYHPWPQFWQGKYVSSNAWFVAWLQLYCSLWCLKKQRKRVNFCTKQSCISLNGLRALYWMQLELQYHQDFAAITGSIGLTASPVVEATGVVGSDGFSVGGELGFDTVSGKFTKYNAGVNYIKPDFNASVIL